MVPMRSVQRDRLLKTRHNMRGTSNAYRTANNMDGAKSAGKTVPPIGAGIETISSFLINAGQMRVPGYGFEKVRVLIVDFNDLPVRS